MENISYENITLEECFTKYHVDKIACICDANNKIVKFMEE